MEAGRSFVIKTADGKKHRITGPHQVALGSTVAVVIGEDDVGHLLPLRSITGIHPVKPRRK